MNKLILANFIYQRVRSLISITGIAVETVLILSIVGLLQGVMCLIRGIKGTNYFFVVTSLQVALCFNLLERLDWS